MAIEKSLKILIFLKNLKNRLSEMNFAAKPFFAVTACKHSPKKQPLGYNCNGCTTCYATCKIGAISMQPDAMGFNYPFIDKAKCTNCKQCTNTCPELSGFIPKEFKIPKTYACWSKNEDIRQKSSSGGVFTELANIILKENGFVVGAKYNDDFTVEHYIVENEAELELLRRSKYVQSEMKDIFKQVKQRLINGQKGLFAGTPCQVAGLNNFLGNEANNLITINLICSSVNSPVVFRKYLQSLERDYGSKVKKFAFRFKDGRAFGWKQLACQITLENGEKYTLGFDKCAFISFWFKKRLYIRKSCYSCSFRTFPQVGDISLADFWKIEKKFDDNKGTSMVLVNSKKGKELFDIAKSAIKYYRRPFSSILKGNPTFYTTAAVPFEREKLEQEIDKLTFEQLAEKYWR